MFRTKQSPAEEFFLSENGKGYHTVFTGEGWDFGAHSNVEVVEIRGEAFHGAPGNCFTFHIPRSSSLKTANVTFSPLLNFTTV